jgi:hypothetical protein
MEDKPHKPNWWYTPPHVGAIHELPQEQPKTRHELPWQAFAVVGHRDDPETWKLPHHTRGINKAIKGKIGIEHSVDWELMPTAVALLSRAGRQGHRVEATEGEIISAARHLANHYRKADKSIPDTLAVLI